MCDKFKKISFNMFNFLFFKTNFLPLLQPERGLLQSERKILSQKTNPGDSKHHSLYAEQQRIKVSSGSPPGP
jgi:hypothetical protein